MSERERHTEGPWMYDGVRVFAPACDETVMVRREDGTDVEHGCGLIALVYAPRNAGTREANGNLIAAAPLMLATLKAVWLLAERLDIGNAERTAFRDLVEFVIEQADSRLHQDADVGPLTADEKNGPLTLLKGRDVMRGPVTP